MFIRDEETNQKGFLQFFNTNLNISIQQSSLNDEITKLANQKKKERL